MSTRIWGRDRLDVPYGDECGEAKYELSETEGDGLSDGSRGGWVAESGVRSKELPRKGSGVSCQDRSRYDPEVKE